MCPYPFRLRPSLRFGPRPRRLRASRFLPNLLLATTLLLALAPAAMAQTVDVTITADNAYSFGYGTVNGLTNVVGSVENTVSAGEIFNCSVGPEKYPNVQQVPNGYLYIVAYSDEAGTQGVLGQFVSGSKTVFTGTSAWEVFATGIDFDPGTGGGPTLGMVNAQIALANTVSGGAGGSRGWVGLNGGLPGSVGTLAIGEANDNPGGTFQQACPASLNPTAPRAIKDAAKWMWYNPSSLANPFSGSVPGEFLIFRLPFKEVVTPRRVIVNKDITNTTGQTATDVDILIAGHHSQISDIFHGTTPNFTFGPSGANDLLVWSGGNIAPGATVHVGFNLPETSVDILGVFMTSNGVIIGCAHQCNSHLHLYGFGGDITYTNSVTDCEIAPLYVRDISVQYFENELELARMNPSSDLSPIHVDSVGIPPVLINPGESARVSIPAAPRGGNWALLRYTVSPTPTGPGSEDFVQVPVPPRPASAGSCASAVTALCLNGSRFRVEVQWRDFTGHTGAGQAVQLTDDTGYYWFFGVDNLELVIKVLDGRPVNQHWWVFYGALSTVEYTIVVTDTATGLHKTYVNPSGHLGSVADTSAFPQ